MDEPLPNLSRLLNEGGSVREIMQVAALFGSVTAKMLRAAKLGRYDEHVPAVVVARLFTKSDLGGRPPQPFWDDLLMAMFKRLYVDGWEPRSKSALATEMESWLLERGMTASTSSIDKRASMIWAALEMRPKH